MERVQIQPSYAPYHIALGDLVYCDMVNSPSPIHASTYLWNALLSLTQRNASESELKAFLERIKNRLVSGFANPHQVQPRFSGQSARSTLNRVEEARKLAISSKPTSDAELANEGISANVPERFIPIIKQIQIAEQIISKK